MPRTRVFVVLLAIVAATTWSLGTVGRTSAAANLVLITSALEPPTRTVAPGDTVTWRNDDTQRHRVRSTSGPTEFDSGDLDPGQSYTASFQAIGTYAYRDDRDPELSNYWGTIIVANPTPSPSAGASGGPASTPLPGDAVIGMAGRVFSPSTVTIPVGGHVTWRNDDSRDHTATSSSGAFDSGIMNPGATFVRTFTTAGAFSFLCLIHPDMTGVVTVTAAPGVTPPPPTPVPLPTPTPIAAAGDVVIVDFAFTPSDMTVDAGTRLTFANHGAAIHTVTATDGSFDSGLLRPNGTYQRVFPVPGTYPFLCALHPTMAGTIRVRGANGATPPPAPAPTPAPPAPRGGVQIVDFSFLPGQIRVPAGSSITWVNAGVAPHTVTSRDGTFGSGILAPRATFTRTFPTPGTFAFICAIHPDMTGVVLVSGSGGAVPPPSPQPPAAAPPSPLPGVGDVRIVDLAFDPAIIDVAVGGTVRFTNYGAAIHTATALDGSFDTGFLNKNETRSVTLAVPGTIRFVCALHPSMVGTIVVGGGGGGSGDLGVPGASTPPTGAGGGGGPGGGGFEPGSGSSKGLQTPPEPRSPVSIALGAIFILLGLAGGTAVVRGIGRRAGEV